MNIGDVVKITRGGSAAGLDWKIIRIRGHLAEVDLVSGSLLGPQWEMLSNLAPAPVRPDPTKTGLCALQLSFACTGAGYERLDPRDMLASETSFRTSVITCLPCYEMAADHYLKGLHS